MDLQFDNTLDLSGKTCPWLILGCKAELSKMADGAVLQVVFTEDSGERDLSVYARQTGHQVLFSGAEKRPDGEARVLVIKKKGAALN